MKFARTRSAFGARAWRTMLATAPLLLSAWGCADQRPPRSVEDTPTSAPGSADASSASTAPTSGARAARAELKVDLFALDTDGGRARALQADGGVLELEGPTRALELQLSSPVRNARIRLFDWNEQLVESDDVLLQSQEGRVTGYRLELLEPLKSGRSYLLGIDGELGPKLLDAVGNDLDDLRVPFSVRGDPEPERPTGKKRPPSKRRVR